jgi:hypothetical protein
MIACTFVCNSFDPRYHPNPNHPNIHMVYNGVDLNNNYGLKTFSHLEIPIKDQCLIGITILSPMDTFFDTISNVDYSYPKHSYPKHSSTCRSNIGVNQPMTLVIKCHVGC